MRTLRSGERITVCNFQLEIAAFNIIEKMETIHFRKEWK